METKKVFVVGSNGFLGSNILRDFLQNGQETYAILRNNSNKWRIEDIIDETNIILMDAVESSRFRKVLEDMKPDIVVNAMGADQKAVLHDPSLNWKSNFLTLVDLANSMRDLKDSILIHAGSSFEYGKVSIIRNPIPEDAKCDPVSEYAVSKVFATDYLKYFSAYNKVKIFVFRIFNLYGPFESKFRLIPDISVKAIHGEKITLKNPSVSRDFIHVNDVAEAFRIASLTADALPNLNILNLGSGVPHTVAEVASLINEINGSSSEIEISLGDQRPENVIPGPIADMKRIKNVLNWRTKYDLKNGLEDVNQWFRNNLSLYEV